MIYRTRKANKYGAQRTETLGRTFDSKFEASVAEELELRKKGKDIKDYDCQFRVEIPIHRPDGELAFKVSHKVDFRVHENDGSYTLIEAKGFETPDFRWRKRLLTQVWLPMNLDHEYEIVYQNKVWRYKR